jgi:hypothetical protein
MEAVYKADPRYSDKATSMFNIDLGAPEVRSTAQRGDSVHGLTQQQCSCLACLAAVGWCGHLCTARQLQLQRQRDLP